MVRREMTRQQSSGTLALGSEKRSSLPHRLILAIKRAFEKYGENAVSSGIEMEYFGPL